MSDEPTQVHSTPPVSQPPPDLAPLENILAEFEGQKGAVIPILQRIQDAYGYLPKEIMAVTSRKTKIPLSQLFGVATFYAQFRLKRRGQAPDPHLRRHRLPRARRAEDGASRSKTPSR